MTIANPASAPDFGVRRFSAYAPMVMRRADPFTLQQLDGDAMGTRWSVKFGNPAMLPLPVLRAAVESALATVVAQMSTWEEDSDISRFNRAPAGSWHGLPPEFLRVLQCALYWARDSGGACDPTVGALVDLWGFGPRPRPHLGPARDSPPPPQAIAAALQCSGWRRLRLDPAGHRVYQPGGVRLDLCGVAKGFAVDQVLQALSALGLRDLLVEVGGELRGQGKRPGGGPWQVAIAPVGPDQAPRTLHLDNQAIATSGDAWHAFEHQGRRYAHTLDPRSGRPVEHSLASVSVLHAQCMHADALATALTVLGPDEGPAFAARRGIAALFVARAQGGLRVTATPAFSALTGP